FGEYQYWIKAEKRWNNRGITLEDVSYMSDEKWPIPREIAQVGFPLEALHHSLIHRDMTSSELIYFWRLLPGKKSKACFASRMIYELSESYRYPKRKNNFHLEEIEILSEAVDNLQSKITLTPGILKGVISLFKKPSESIEILNRLGMKTRKIEISDRDFHSQEWTEKTTAFIESEFNQNPTLDGLQSIVAMMAVTHRFSFPHRTVLDHISKDSDIVKNKYILEMCQPGITESTFSYIADSYLKINSNDPEDLGQFIAVFKNHLMDNIAVAKFLEILWSKVPSEPKVKDQIIELATTLLSQKTSNLCDEKIWANLDLPSELRKILI
ncbi:MAG: hypothetical protein PHW04_19105, partial [Candidatus Wallbacteria bacterium]|nr:hypothetical protein [Candidatus Wallbacteria bacterium]